MILCLSMLFIGVVSLVLGLIFVCKDNLDAPMWAMFATVAGVVLIFIAAVLLVLCPLESQKDLNVFVAQKEYIENYNATSEYDTVAITNKKIELNEWLYKVQYTKTYHPICSFYGDEILELEPIK